MDEAMAAALDRVAESFDTLTATVREDGRATRAMLAQLLEPQDASPIADALEALTGRVGALEETQGALVPVLQDIVRLARQRRNGGAA